jgi:hypothetical protein
VTRVVLWHAFCCDMCCVVTVLCCDSVVLWHCCVVTVLCCDSVVFWHCWVVKLLCCDSVVLWVLCCDSVVLWVLCCDSVELWQCCVVTVLSCDTVVLWQCCVVLCCDNSRKWAIWLTYDNSNWRNTCKAHNVRFIIWNIYSAVSLGLRNFFRGVF